MSIRRQPSQARPLGEIDHKIIVQARKNTLEKGGPIAGIVSRLEMSPFPISAMGRLRVEMTLGSQIYLCGALNFEPPQNNPSLNS